jgi:hypothetical protein
MMMDKKTGFSWRLFVVYGSPYDEGKQAFLTELDSVMAHWQGPTIIASDFNLVRFSTDKSNGIINHKWADLFNNWVSTWSLIELDPSNKKFTWSNNQENLVMAKIDRVFISTDWEVVFPLANVKASDRPPSGHNPLLLNAGDNAHFGKKKFRFEKWWLEREDFRGVVCKAWNETCRETNAMDRWKFKLEALGG